MATELEMLFDEINKFDYYPANIKRISGDIPESIFFPGGQGIFSKVPGSISDKEIMVVGDQFNYNLNMNKAHGLKKNRLKISPAWSNLLLLCIYGNIDPEKCFFTNTLLGVAIPNKTGKKPSEYTRNYFTEHCKKIFQKELEIQKPKLILVLGLKAARFLSIFHHDLQEWSNIRSLSKVDQQGLTIIRNVPLTETSTTTLVLLTHPIGRHANIASRKFGKYSGNKAEIEMLLHINQKQNS